MAQSIRRKAVPKVLLIGGTGYIGSHLAAHLHAEGYVVTVLGRRQITAAECVAGVTYVRGDFVHAQVLCPLLDDHDTVVYLAYATVPNTSFNDPLADLQQNLPPAVRLFTEIAARNQKLILMSSGGTIYGEALALPIAENQPAHPISPYGVTKLTLENYAYLYAATHGLNYVCARPANAYGPGQRPFSGQGFIATAIASVMRSEPIAIFGERGTVRDYVYVTDLARGIAKLIAFGKPSQTYNLGSGQGRSNMDVVDALTPMMRGFGYAIRVNHLPERPFDVKANVLDSQKIGALAGWEPTVGFEHGLRLTYEWLKQYAA